MSVKQEQRCHQPSLSDLTSDFLSSRSISTWIQSLQTPPSTSSSLPSLSPPSSKSALLEQQTPTRAHKRARSLDSLPSEFLGDGPRFRKSRKIQREAEVDMVDQHYPTPSQDGSTPGLSRPTTKSASTPNTIPRTPTAKKPKLSLDESDIGIQMDWYGLKFNHGAYEKAADFKLHIEEIVLGDRGSAMRPESVKRFKEVLDVSGLFAPINLSSLLRMRHTNFNITKIYQWANEHTFLYHIIPILQGYGYHVSKEAEETPPEQEAGETLLEQEAEETSPEQEIAYRNEERVWRDFLSDEKVVNILDKDFARTLLPGGFLKQPLLVDEITKHLAKDKSMTNPRPDMVFGLKREKDSFATSIPQQILDLLWIAPGIHHPFLILEGKSHSGSSATAENQARRGGATLVKASRALRAILEGNVPTLPDLSNQEAEGLADIGNDETHPVKPDLKSFVFSITISPTNFSIWVHWYDMGNHHYHMNLVESWSLHNSKGPAQIRWAWHNIIEFGVWTRRAQNEDLLELIRRYAIIWNNKQAEDQVKAVKSVAKSTESATESLVQKRSYVEE